MGNTSTSRIPKSKNRKMKKTVYIILSIVLFIANLQAQKIDTDSLLVKTYYELKTTKNYTKAIELAKLGIKTAPSYVDFNVVLGRSYMLIKKTDSSRVYFNRAINQNPKYKEVFSYLTKLEIQDKNLSNAKSCIDKALHFYPDDLEFNLLKLNILELENDKNKTMEFLDYLIVKYPSNLDFKQKLTQLKTKLDSDRIGINYSYTTFSRSGVGPWQLSGLQYIREREKITLVGRINYADRQSFGTSISSGFQYEFETYIKNNSKSYSYLSSSYSDDIVFPKLRLGYSYFHNFKKGWEGDIGVRYTKTVDDDLYAGVFGVGKYVGSYWINFKSYLLINKSEINPAFTATARYYFDTKYDYATILIGYGSSPDERVSLVDIQKRISLNSYRVGAGYYKSFNNHYLTGIQTIFNNQEYVQNKTQNEFEIALMFQYKF
jgi:YaiO family outer membrane protein